MHETGSGGLGAVSIGVGVDLMIILVVMFVVAGVAIWQLAKLIRRLFG